MVSTGAACGEVLWTRRGSQACALVEMIAKDDEVDRSVNLISHACVLAGLIKTWPEHEWLPSKSVTGTKPPITVREHAGVAVLLPPGQHWIRGLREKDQDKLRGAAAIASATIRPDRAGPGRGVSLHVLGTQAIHLLVVSTREWARGMNEDLPGTATDHARGAGTHEQAWYERSRAGVEWLCERLEGTKWGRGIHTPAIHRFDEWQEYTFITIRSDLEPAQARERIATRRRWWR